MNKINEAYYNFFCDTLGFKMELLKIVASLSLDRRKVIFPLWYSIKPMLLKQNDSDIIFQFTARFIKKINLKAVVDMAFKEKMGNS